MNAWKLSALVSLTCLGAHAQSFTPAQAEKVVKGAVAYARQNGMDNLVLQTKLPHGVFHVGSGSELYLFAYDHKGVAVANGYQPELIGSNRWDVKDADGKFQVRDMVRVARTKGSGWVKYKYSNPVTRKVEDKATYVEAFENFVFCCGIYKD